MKNPPHPGRLLRADFEALGLSVAEAEGLGVTRQQVYTVLNLQTAYDLTRAQRHDSSPAVS